MVFKIIPFPTHYPISKPYLHMQSLFHKIYPILRKNDVTQNVLYNKVLNVSCNLLNTLLKMKNDCKSVGCLSLDHMAD